MLGNTFKSALLISLMAFATGAMADITFSATQDGSTMTIDKEMFDTDAAKQFLKKKELN